MCYDAPAIVGVRWLEVYDRTARGALAIGPLLCGATWRRRVALLHMPTRG